jgi:serine phosphatase RsbU (regulator of sigma subunit)
MLSKLRKKKDLDQEFKNLCNQADGDLAVLNGILGIAPDQIEKMIRNCEEMLLDSLPDKTADYFEERSDINKWKGLLEQARDSLADVQADHAEKEAKYKEIKASYKKATEIEDC